MKNTDKRPDLRIQKTYDALIAAFEALLQEKSFEEITVKELCDRARIRTATFYTHFEDKYDFFFYMVRSLRQSFASHVGEMDDRHEAADYYVDLLQCGMQYLEQNVRMVNSIRGSDMLVAMLHLMQDDMTAELQRHLMQDADAYSTLYYPDIMVQFLIGGMNQITEWWFSQRGAIDQDAVLADTKVLVSGMLQ